MPARMCKTCASDPGLPTRNRPAPHPGPRCATHHRQWVKLKRAERHEAHVQRTYGLLPGEYAELLALQGGKCAICRRATGARKKLAVDHDHRTGRVRGLLCGICNHDVLGHARDDVEYFRRAIDYLLSPPYDRLEAERPTNPEE